MNTHDLSYGNLVRAHRSRIRAHRMRLAVIWIIGLVAIVWPWLR